MTCIFKNFQVRLPWILKLCSAEAIWVWDRITCENLPTNACSKFPKREAVSECEKRIMGFPSKVEIEPICLGIDELNSIGAIGGLLRRMANEVTPAESREWGLSFGVVFSVTVVSVPLEWVETGWEISSCCCWQQRESATTAASERPVGIVGRTEVVAITAP